MIPLGVSYRRVLLDAELARLAPTTIRGAVLDGWPAVARSPFLSSFSTGFVVVGRRR